MEAYLLSITGVVDLLPYMLNARYYHGVIEISSKSSVYVFGGGKC